MPRLWNERWPATPETEIKNQATFFTAENFEILYKISLPEWNVHDQDNYLLDKNSPQ